VWQSRPGALLSSTPAPWLIRSARSAAQQGAAAAAQQRVPIEVGSLLASNTGARAASEALLAAAERRSVRRPETRQALSK
jgi:hypothetical protein